MTSGRGSHPARAVRGRHRPLVAAVSLAILVAVAGCAVPEEAPDDVGPAEAYVDLVLGIGDEQVRQQYLRYQEALATCMADSGFEYLPTLSGLVIVDQAAVDPPRDSREFAEQYGYAYRSRPPGMTSTSSPGDDPNDALIEAMSEAEVTEYYAARDGTWFEDYLAAGTPDDVEGDWRRGGCDGRAMHEIYDAGPDTDPTYLALKAEIDRIDAQVVPIHPDVVAADAAWTACMADAGFPGYARQPEAEERELERYYASGDGEGVVGPDGKTAGEVEKLPQEVAIATADWVCADQVRYHDVVARVRNEAQQEYVDTHRDELDALVERFAAAERPTG